MKLLLIADVHNKTHGSKKSLTKIKKAIDKADCDLIVFLGDIVHGPSTPNNYEKYLRQVLDLTLNTPFATVFGNHDDECSTTKKEILSIINSYDNALTNGENYVLEMMGETLLFIDSGTYYDGEESYYDIVKNEQIAFALDKINGKKAILFQHIIIPDIMNTIDEFDYHVKGSVEDNKKYYKFKNDIQYTGKLGERPCPPDISTGEFEILSPHLKAMCFGHDHKNSFELEYNGVKLIQCAGSGNNSYDKFCKSSVKILDTKTLKTQMIYL
jgi:Icc-related predicted phosphoesterase